MVIRSPHDPENNPVKNNTSDFSIRDPLSLPAVIGTGFTWQCGGIAQLVELLILCHEFDSRCFPIPTYLGLYG